MKAKYFLIAFLFISFTVFAQEKKVPKAVKDSFSKLYPKVTDVKWDKEGKAEYEAGFKENGKDVSVVFDEKGNLIETETAIQISELPKSVAPFVEKNYAGFKITEAAKIVNAKGEVTYEAEITKGKVKKDLLFDANGKPEKKDVNKEKENEKEDEEDKD
ncbi:MAG: PepSY-like domain-containing protein [Ignavibacteriales bacterium]